MLIYQVRAAVPNGTDLATPGLPQVEVQTQNVEGIYGLIWMAYAILSTEISSRLELRLLSEVDPDLKVARNQVVDLSDFINQENPPALVATAPGRFIFQGGDWNTFVTDIKTLGDTSATPLRTNSALLVAEARTVIATYDTQAFVDGVNVVAALFNVHTPIRATIVNPVLIETPITRPEIDAGSEISTTVYATDVSIPTEGRNTGQSLR